MFDSYNFLVKVVRRDDQFRQEVTVDEKNVEDNKTYYNLRNTIEHEKYHYNKTQALPTEFSEAKWQMSSGYKSRSETGAVNYQKSKPSWEKTTSQHKKIANDYAKKYK